jgi:Na+/proline symporter
MTNAEWMEFRFGSGKGGEFARLVTAMVSSIGVIAYLSVGVGKFLSLYLPFSPKICALLMIAVVIIYTVLGGLYSVAFTDLLQTILLSFVAIFLAVISFSQLEALGGVISPGWDSFVPAWKLSLPEEYSMYNMFTLCLLVWIVQGLTIGFGSTTTDVYTPPKVLRC